MSAKARAATSIVPSSSALGYPVKEEREGAGVGKIKLFLSDLIGGLHSRYLIIKGSWLTVTSVTVSAPS